MLPIRNSSLPRADHAVIFKASLFGGVCVSPHWEEILFLPCRILVPWSARDPESVADCQCHRMMGREEEDLLHMHEIQSR
jgi:hypothetical protein